MWSGLQTAVSLFYTMWSASSSRSQLFPSLPPVLASPQPVGEPGCAPVNGILSAGMSRSMPCRPSSPSHLRLDRICRLSAAPVPPPHPARQRSPPTTTSRPSSNLPRRRVPLVTQGNSARTPGPSSSSETYAHTHNCVSRVCPISRPSLTSLQLPYRVRWQDLKDLFRKAGTVLRADVSIGPDNRSRGFGTVLLASAEDAGRAIDMFHGFTWQTRTLEVRPDRIPPELINPTLPGSGVGYVAPGPTTSGIGVPTTYGSNPIMAPGPSPLLASTNVHRDFDFSSVRGLERPRSTASASRALFVGNVSARFHWLSRSHLTQRQRNVQLPFHCQWQDLKDLFRQAGAVIRADVTLGADGRSRGFGTVVYASEADADRAVKVFNGSDVPSDDSMLRAYCLLTPQL